MKSDLFCDLTINIKAAQLFGLNSAAYLALLLKIYNKACYKDKLVEKDYFKVDRKYITNVLGLLQEEQLVCDHNLMKLAILKKHPDDPDIVSIDINMYLSLLASDDVKLFDEVRKQMKINKPKGVKQSQRQSLINNLKDSITCSNYELLTALRDWVEGVYARPNGFLSKSAIQIFQDTLNKYTQGDLDLALRIVKIATVQGYRDCTWAIHVYEKDNKMKANNIGVRVTEQAAADAADISDIVF